MDAGKVAPRRLLPRYLAVAIPSLAAATVVIAILEGAFGVGTASSIYLVAVVASALVGGTAGAIATSVASFLLYDFFFIEPVLTLTVRDPAEWINLFLLLFVGIIVGQLAALQRRQTDMARRREHEARVLSQVSRQLATSTTAVAALPAILVTLRDETNAERVWVTVPTGSGPQVVAATSPGPAAPESRTTHVLRRPVPDGESAWVGVHGESGGERGPRRPTVAPLEESPHRVAIEAGGRTIGQLWLTRGRALARPDAAETRLLAAAADQIGQAMEQDRLAAETREAEIVRRSDQLKSALLESVSHDLRTPLASIRAAAGTLMDPSVELPEEERLESAAAIDGEVEYLDRLVTNLLDLGRIEAGSLRAEHEVVDIADPIDRALHRLSSRLGDRPVEVDVDPTLLVEVDPVFLDQILTNLLDNAAKYAGAGRTIRVSAREDAASVAQTWLIVEDAGEGVPEASLDRLFEKFYRVPGRTGGSRRGTGLGLAVVRGLAEAMGGRVEARRSGLGGLAVAVSLPTASRPASEDAVARGPAPEARR